jgi:TRAP-type transport system periplasmic protein
MKKVLFFSVVGLFVCLVSAISTYAQTPIEWRVHTPHVQGRSEWVMEKEWADNLTNASGGRLKVNLYPSGSLGFRDADMIRICGGNVIEGFMFYPGYLTRDAAIITLTSPEMILHERKHFVAFSPFAGEMAKKELAKKKIRLSAYFASPATKVVVIGKRPINTLASMKGGKIRGWEVQQTETFRRLGIQAQVMAQGDLYLAFKTGVLDAAVNGVTGSLSLSLYEVAQYLSILYEGSMLLGMATSEAAFNALPADLQEMVKKVENELNKKWLAEAVSWEQLDIDIIEKDLRGKGMNILPPFPIADKESLVKTGIEVWRDRAKEVGPEAVDYQQKLEAELLRVKPK